MIESLKRLTADTANLVTMGAVAVLLIAGIAWIDGNSNWWKLALTVTAAFAFVVAFLNIRSFVKAAFTVLFTIVASSFAFQTGTLLDYDRGAFGITWMGCMLALFFALLAISYLGLSGRSRWSTILLSEAVLFIVTYMLAMSRTPLLLALGIGVCLASLCFFLLFFVFNRINHNAKGMPKQKMDFDDATGFCKNLKDSWNTLLSYSDKDKTGNILVWNSEHAYLLVPVKFEHAIETMRKNSLGYNGKSLNPWLLGLLSRVNRIHGADVTLVLLDITNANGDKPLMLGVSIADSNKSIPVLVAPGKQVTRSQELMRIIDETMSPNKVALTKRQSSALSKLGGEED